jgi:uncharacterized cupin superfamily protein
VTEEARLEESGSGLAPATDGWFLLNLRDAAWYAHDAFGTACDLEGETRFAELGINVHVLRPGEPNGLYHAETAQEDFLVLSGECLLLVEGQERRLRAWDFVHCPPGTEHIFVGAGDGPCAILMVGARPVGRGIRYPVSELALRCGAGVEVETTNPREAYTGSHEWHPTELPDPALPWT